MLLDCATRCSQIARIYIYIFFFIYEENKNIKGIFSKWEKEEEVLLGKNVVLLFIYLNNW